MNKGTIELLAKARKIKRQNREVTSYIFGASGESREIAVKAACRRAIRINRKAIEMLADK